MEVDWVAGAEPAAAVGIHGQARASPLQNLGGTIVNDTAGGVPVTMTHCPPCKTAVSFRRPVVDSRATTFGTSGRLYQSDLVTYDRATGSLWPQAPGIAVTGELSGRRLERVQGGDRHLAVPYSRLAGRADSGAAAVDLDLAAAAPLLVVWRSGATSALDRRQIAASRDVGAAASFQRLVGGRAPTFHAAAGRVADR